VAAHVDRNFVTSSFSSKTRQVFPDASQNEIKWLSYFLQLPINVLQLKTLTNFEI